MKILANEQAFQSIYLDSNPEKWAEKIVFLDPMFDTLPPAEMVFKTLRLEDRSGLVVSGPKTDLVKLKNHIDEADSRDAIGKSNDKEILKYLSDLSGQNNLTIEYTQSSVEAKFRIKAKLHGFKALGNIFLSENGTKAISLIDGEILSLNTIDFKIKKSADFSKVESSRSLNLNDPYLIPIGLSKVESARWYINAKRVLKPTSTLEAIADLASKSGICKAED